MSYLDNLGFLVGASRFRRVSDQLYYQGDKIYEQAGISFKASWFAVYHFLSHAEQPMTVLEVAQAIGFTHITVKNIVQELAKNQYVQVEQNPADKRSKLIQLTPKGQQYLKELQPVWGQFAEAIKQVLVQGHPDVLRIMQRIDAAIDRKPLAERVRQPDEDSPVTILDYTPSLKPYFFELAGGWLLDMLQGTLEAEDEFTLHNPDQAYIVNGGFVFFASYKTKIVGCVALKRLSDDEFEFAKLFINPEYRMYGIATRLIDRCLSRCQENAAKTLWLQTTNALKPAHKLYYKLGFQPSPPPSAMKVLNRTELIMKLDV